MRSFALFFAVVVAVASAYPAEPTKFKESEVVPILAQEMDLQPDGSFVSSFETGNGIKMSEHAVVKNFGDHDVPVVDGAVDWTDDQGIAYHLTYTADENGYVPKGEHLPTPPPTPEPILRALAYIAAHPQADEKIKKF